MRLRSNPCLLATAIRLAAALPVLGADLSPSDIMSDAARFDGKAVTVRGAVTLLREKVSGRGNPYYTFELSDTRRTVHVFSFGRSPCREGVTMTVDGEFRRVKRVGKRTFYNEVEAGSVACR